jgi:hypothetical protein
MVLMPATVNQDDQANQANQANRVHQVTATTSMETKVLQELLVSQVPGVKMAVMAETETPDPQVTRERRVRQDFEGHLVIRDLEDRKVNLPLAPQEVLLVKREGQVTKEKLVNEVRRVRPVQLVKLENQVKMALLSLNLPLKVFLVLEETLVHQANKE